MIICEDLKFGYSFCFALLVCIISFLCLTHVPYHHFAKSWKVQLIKHSKILSNQRIISKSKRQWCLRPNSSVTRVIWLVVKCDLASTLQLSRGKRGKSTSSSQIRFLQRKEFGSGLTALITKWVNVVCLTLHAACPKMYKRRRISWKKLEYCMTLEDEVLREWKQRKCRRTLPYWLLEET